MVELGKMLLWDISAFFWDLLLALAFVQAIIRLTLIAVQRLKSKSRGSPPQKARGDLRRFSSLLMRVVICISLFILTRYRRIILHVQTYIYHLLHLLHWLMPHPYWYLLEFLSKLSTFISLLIPPPLLDKSCFQLSGFVPKEILSLSTYKQKWYFRRRWLHVPTL